MPHLARRRVDRIPLKGSRLAGRQWHEGGGVQEADHRPCSSVRSLTGAARRHRVRRRTLPSVSGLRTALRPAGRPCRPRSHSSICWSRCIGTRSTWSVRTWTGWGVGGGPGQGRGRCWCAGSRAGASPRHDESSGSGLESRPATTCGLRAGGPYVAESEPHSRSSGARCDSFGGPPTVCLTPWRTSGATRQGRAVLPPFTSSRRIPGAGDAFAVGRRGRSRDA